MTNSDTNNNGIDDSVETELHVKGHSRKFNLTCYGVGLGTVALACAYLFKQYDLVPGILGWTFGLICGYGGINVADKSFDNKDLRKHERP